MAAVSAPGDPSGSPALAALARDIAWYDNHAKRGMAWYRALKLVQLVVAAAVPVGASLSAARALLAVLGAVIVVVEGVQQLFHFHDNWINYRSTCEALREEQRLYEAAAGPYTDGRRDELLAERTRDVIAQERARWASTQRESPDSRSSS